MKLIGLTAFSFSLIASLVTTAPCGDKPYIYLSDGRAIQATVSDNCYMIKFSSEYTPEDAIRALKNLGYDDSHVVPYSPGDTLLVLKSPVGRTSSLELVKSIPGVRFAMPVFRGATGIEYGVGNRIVVVLKRGMTENDLTSLNRLHNSRIVFRDPYSLSGERLIIASSWDSKLDAFELAEAYRRSNSVLFASPSFYVFHPWDAGGEPEDEYYGDQWYLDKIKALEAWNYTYGSSSIKIAVLDVGVDLQHDDLAGQFVQGYDAVANDNDPSPGGLTSADAHGTQCAGIIGAIHNRIGIAGVAPGCKIMPIRVGSASGYQDADVVTGINWARVNGADILSMSFSNPNPMGKDDWDTALVHAGDWGRSGKGCVLVASTGNNASGVNYPAAFVRVIAVGATNGSDAKWGYSCYGPQIDVVAPSAVYGTGPFVTLDLRGTSGSSADDHWSSFGGTSAACPQVAALAGLILSQHSDYTRIQVQRLIQETADDVDAAGFDNNTGWGRINAKQALRSPTTSGTLVGNQVWQGSVSTTGALTIPSGLRVTVWENTTLSVGGNITIEPGGQLIIESGSTVNLGGNYKIRVEGKLTASGVVFSRSGGQWYGIEFYSGNPGSSLYNCTIQNAQYGVYVYNTNPAISHSTIRYNGTGIYGSYFYNPSVDWNLIEENTYGVSCNQYSDLDLSPSNIIRYNGWAVSTDASSAPCLGTTAGYNSIYWNDYYDIYSSYSGTIYALGNWWGDYPPYPSIAGNVDYSSALSWNPNNWAKVSVHPLVRSTIKPNESELRETDTLGIAEFDRARILFLKDQGSSITNTLTSLVSRYPNSLAGEKALVLLGAIDERVSIDSKPMLNSILAEKAGTRMGNCAALLLLCVQAREGQYREALAIAQSLINSTDPRVEKHALYNAGNISWSFLGDKELGTGYFQTLAKKYPDDPLTLSCLSTMRLEPSSPPKNQALEKVGTPLATDLSAAYPNPFNPTTTIDYQLASPGFVSLKIYDVLGREVKLLVSENRAAGHHQATLNASSLASGVYYARLMVSDNFGNLAFTKVTKLLLAK